MASSVVLQQLLYLNVLFSPGWFVTFVVILARKYGQGVALKDPDEVRIAMTIIWLITEPLRLLAGYTGNLKENVGAPPPSPPPHSFAKPPSYPACKPSLLQAIPPASHAVSQNFPEGQQYLIGENMYPAEQVPVLGVFLMVTLFLEGPIVVYLLGWQKDITPLDQAINTVMAALLAAQFLAGLVAINKIMRSQVEKYYLIDFTREGLFGAGKSHIG